MNIKAREAGFDPSAVVVVATIRALKCMVVLKDQLQHENIEAVEAGLVNLERHVNNIKNTGSNP